MRKGRTVADLMTPHVVTATPTTTVRQAANLMRGRSIGCLVVTNGSRVAGNVLEAQDRLVQRDEVWVADSHQAGSGARKAATRDSRLGSSHWSIGAAPRVSGSPGSGASREG